MSQADLLRHVVDVLEGLNIQYMLVGSIASGAYGEPRLTRDIDIVLELKAGDIADFSSAFPGPEYYVNEAAIRDAVRTRFQFNVLHPTSGNKIDFIFPSNDAWGKSQLRRRQRVLVLPDQEGFTANINDVIIGKLRYYAEGGSEKHLRDITGILRVSGQLVDRNEIANWAKQLGLEEVWNQLVRKVNEP